MASRCRSRVSRPSLACASAKWNLCRHRSARALPFPLPVFMRRFLWLIFLPAGLAAQRPAVSPVLPRLLSRVQDTTISVWLFAQPTASLDASSECAAAAGARVRVRSRWLHAVSADVPAAALHRLLEDRDLRRVQPLGRFKLRPPVLGRPVLDAAPCIITAPG